MRQRELAARSRAAIAAAAGAVAIVAAGGRVAAQPTPGADPDVPAFPQYRVELIVFAHNDVDPGEELFAPELDGEPPSQPVPLLERPPSSAREGRDADTRNAPDGLELIDPFGRLGAATEARPPFQFRILAPEELELTQEHARIDRLGAYRVLAHVGWIQEARDGSAALPMNLANLGIVNPSGTLRLRFSRFLHLNVDLRYHAPQPVAGAGAPPAPGVGGGIGPGARTSVFSDSMALDEVALRPSYRMVEERRVPRSGELHYVDHPIFGLLFKITPVPVEDPDAEAAPTTPAA